MGWADFRITDYSQIHKWWEIASAPSHGQSSFSSFEYCRSCVNQSTDLIVAKFKQHDWWDKGQGWKNILNNLRLVIQPFVFFNLIKPG